MIEKVIHMADIHIPNDVSDRPYSEMVKVLMSSVLKEVKKCSSPSNARIVVVGDVFHQKIRTTNEARQVFHEMLNFMDAICPTIIVAGNHDMLENNMDRTDSISPTFEINGAYENVTFIDKSLDYKSGYVVDDGVVWVLFSMFDRFAKPNIDGLRDEYPEHKFVGLYHGDYAGAVTDIGRMSDSGVDPSYFEGLDCVMAGHIHKHQMIKKGGVPLVYAGSVFQRDAGENISGHGFVVWDIATMKCKLKEVPNKYRTIRFSIDSYDDVSNDCEQVMNL